jgi:hypothetical protein
MRVGDPAEESPAEQEKPTPAQPEPQNGSYESFLSMFARTR